jgi:hypothetical protein
MGGITTFIKSVIILGLVFTGLVYIVHPPAAREIAKRTGKVAVALFISDEILSYLWADRVGRSLLIATVVFIVAALARGRKE